MQIVDTGSFVSPVNYHWTYDFDFYFSLLIISTFLETKNSGSSTEPFEESVWCCCKLDNSDKLLIENVYRSPNSSPENNKKLNVLLESAMQASYSHRRF